MAAAESAGRVIPGRRKTTTWEKGFAPGWVVDGMAYKKEVGDGVSMGVVITGWPAGTRPNSAG